MSMRSVQTRNWLRLAVLAVLAVVTGAVFGACTQEQGAPAATYTVRGVIKSLPTAGRSEAMFLHHEAVPTFVNREGKQSGMMSMSMPFGVAPGVSLGGLEAGDKVELTFAVRWDQNPVTQVTAIRELPADTALELSGF